MRDYLQGKRCMVWTFMYNTRMFQALEKYGDRFDTVGVFCFKVDKTGTITAAESNINRILPYVEKWPHIRWLLTVANDGYASIFTAVRENTDGAQDKFISEIVRIMEEYPWATGIDIDLEKGGGYENKNKANALFKRIYETVKEYDPEKEMNICLPGMTSEQGSVGGENWCVYGDLDAYCDTCAIMSYGMAWAGSAPGPVSPKDWLDGIYDYASSVMTPSKLFLGMPAYGWNWRIHQSPEDMGKSYRATSQTYYAAKNWMNGVYNFTDDAPPQPFIPFVSYWDDYDHVPWGMPHVYDYMEGQDAIHYENPVVGDTYNRKRFLTVYQKKQVANFSGVYLDVNGGDPTKKTGKVSIENSYASMGEKGKLEYEFTVEEDGIFDIPFKVCFPFWDQNAIKLSLYEVPPEEEETEDGETDEVTEPEEDVIEEEDSSEGEEGEEEKEEEILPLYTATFSEERLWWPYWRTSCWMLFAEWLELKAGTYKMVVETVSTGVLFYGFKLCDFFTDERYGGEAVFKLSPRRFLDVNGEYCEPDKGFRLTPEVLRRSPDSALIWYEDFRDTAYLPRSYWIEHSGEFRVWRDMESTRSRPYSQLDGYGKVGWKYGSFKDLHIRCRIAFPMDGGGKSGVFVGDLFLCINFDSQRLELYQGDNLLGSYSAEYVKTSDELLRTDPSTYTFEMRIRGNKIRVYSGSAYTYRFTAYAEGYTGGYAGLQAEQRTICELLRIGDAWTYEPYERFDVIFPDGSKKIYGRVNRKKVYWDTHFQVFRVLADIEESETREEAISMDYDFVHSDIMKMDCGSDYTITIRPVDINVWISRLFLGDADGFSILYYQDVDSLVYWSNQAAYKWQLRGMAVWSLGQEDMRVWESLPKQTE